METLLNNQDKLTIRWNPGCAYMGAGKYAVGCIGRIGHNQEENCCSVGRTGPTGTTGPMENTTGSMENTKIPDAIHLTITSTDKLTLDEFNKICEELEKSGYESEIHKTLPREIVETEIKPEYLEKYKTKEERESVIQEKIDKNLDELIVLGCEGLDYYRKPFTVPEEWKQVTNRYYDMKTAGIRVYCHKDTEIYKILLNSGILEKSFPEWYRKNMY